LTSSLTSLSLALTTRQRSIQHTLQEYKSLAERFLQLDDEIIDGVLGSLVPGIGSATRSGDKVVSPSPSGQPTSGDQTNTGQSNEHPAVDAHTNLSVFLRTIEQTRSAVDGLEGSLREKESVMHGVEDELARLVPQIVSLRVSTRPDPTRRRADESFGTSCSYRRLIILRSLAITLGSISSLNWIAGSKTAGHRSSGFKRNVFDERVSWTRRSLSRATLTLHSTRVVCVAITTFRDHLYRIHRRVGLGPLVWDDGHVVYPFDVAFTVVVVVVVVEIYIPTFNVILYLHNLLPSTNSRLMTSGTTGNARPRWIQERSREVVEPRYNDLGSGRGTTTGVSVSQSIQGVDEDGWMDVLRGLFERRGRPYNNQ